MPVKKNFTPVYLDIYAKELHSDEPASKKHVRPPRNEICDFRFSGMLKEWAACSPKTRQ